MSPRQVRWVRSTASETHIRNNIARRPSRVDQVAHYFRRSILAVPFLISHVSENLSNYDDICHEGSRTRAKDHSVGLIPPGDTVTSHDVGEIKKQAAQNIGDTE